MTTMSRPIDWRTVSTKPVEMTITPKIALEMLEANTRNRHIRASHVDFLVEEFKAGRCVFDGSPIKFSASGILLDGQHRLRAVVESGVALRAVVIGGLSDEAMATIDTGIPRTLSDAYRLNGSLNNTQTAALARLVNTWSDTDGISAVMIHKKLSNARGLEVLRDFPEIADSVAWYARQPSDVRMYMPAAASFCHWLLSRYGGERGDQWISGMIAGTGLREEDPRVALRRYLMGSMKSTRATKTKVSQIATTVKAWNCYLTGKKVSLSIFRSGEAFPIPRRPEEFA